MDEQQTDNKSQSINHLWAEKKRKLIKNVTSLQCNAKSLSIPVTIINISAFVLLSYKLLSLVEIKMLNQVKAFENRSDKNLGWSLKSFVLWMQIIGIHIPNKKNFTRILHSFYSYLICLANIAINVMQIICFIYKCKTDSETPNKNSEAEVNIHYFNLLIDNINFAVHSVGIHLVIVFGISRSWSQITDSLIATENFLAQNNRVDYIKLRNVCAAGIIYILISVRIVHFRFGRLFYITWFCIL